MSSNSFGKLFCLTSFGESHGPFIGGVIDGCPSNFKLDIPEIQSELARRKPGQSPISTQRKEEDEVEFISGLFEGKTTGMPIAFLIKNKDAKSKDYSHIKEQFRPSHADFTWEKKYGIRDYRGGGRSSARETAIRVVAGAIAKQILAKKGLSIHAYTHSISTIEMDGSRNDLNLDQIDSNAVRCPDPKLAAKMEAAVKEAAKQGDSLGGVIACKVLNVPVGLGEPVYDRLEANLAKAMLSINASKGFEIGSGFSGTKSKGSEHNDEWVLAGSEYVTKSNNSGGVQGGISNGMPIEFKVAFKPVATIMQSQRSLDIHGNEVEIEGKGRHDPCVVPRAVPIVEAMAALVLLDHMMMNNSVNLKL